MAAVIASLGYDLFSAEFWKHFGDIMLAGKDNPLGVVMGIFIFLSLVVLGLGATGSEKLKGFMVASVAVAAIAFVGFIYAGDLQLGKTLPRREGNQPSVSGRVINSRTKGPVVGATVTLATEGIPRTTLTNSTGYWVVDNFSVPAGRHLTVTVDAPDYESYQGDYSASDASQPPTIPLTPKESQTPTVQPIHPADDRGKGSTTSQTVTVVGTVSTRKNAPVAGAEVLVKFGSPPIQRKATTVDDGSFRVFDVSVRSDMQIVVRADGYRTKTLNVFPKDVTHSIDIQLDAEPAK